MLSTFIAALAQADAIRLPAYLPWVALGLLGVGGLGWLIAAVLGFSRARAFGESPRWFAISAVCLLLYHLQWFVVVIYGVRANSIESLVSLLMFFNLFVALGAICAVVGFMRMNDARFGIVASNDLD